MKYLYLFILILFVYFGAYSQGWQPVGARSNSLANATVADVDTWSYYHNPGALGYMQKASVGISYENRFALKELQTQGLVYVQPLKVGVLSVGLQTFGYKVYRSDRFGIGYALKLHEKISMGVQLNYQDVWIRGYDYVGTVTAEIGLLAQITKDLTIGFSVLNLNRAKVADFANDRFGTYIRLGLKYNVSDIVNIYVEAEKEFTSKIHPKVAVDYQVVKDFYIRVGGSYNPAEVTFGFGYNFKFGLRLDAGSAWTQFLGWSPHAGLTYNFKKKVKHESE